MHASHPFGKKKGSVHTLVVVVEDLQAYSSERKKKKEIKVKIMDRNLTFGCRMTTKDQGSEVEARSRLG